MLVSVSSDKSPPSRLKFTDLPGTTSTWPVDSNAYHGNVITEMPLVAAFLQNFVGAQTGREEGK